MAPVAIKANVPNSCLLAAIIVTLGPLSAQEKEYRPTCNMCPGTYVPSSEVQRLIEEGRRPRRDAQR